MGIYCRGYIWTSNNRRTGITGNERVSSWEIPDARLHTTETETETGAIPPLGSAPFPPPGQFRRGTPHHHSCATTTATTTPTTLNSSRETFPPQQARQYSSSKSKLKQKKTHNQGRQRQRTKSQGHLKAQSPLKALQSSTQSASRVYAPRVHMAM